MNAPVPAPRDALADAVVVSPDGRTTIEVRQVAHPEAVRGFDTAALRRHFLIERLFEPGRVHLTYSHLDRLVLGGAVPNAEPLALEALKPIGTPAFLARRELVAFNLGGPGVVEVGGAPHDLARHETLYVPMGAGEVRFASRDVAAPARFYLLSAPAHQAHPLRKLALADAKRLELGSAATANRRTLYQIVHPETCASCQLVMGMTVMVEGSVWNTMPCHVHDRRCEAYLYTDLPADGRVIHLMGEPQETRHLVVADDQAILSPGWSIHSGVGTASYAFVWAMAGDNQDFTDMDMVPMSGLR